MTRSRKNASTATPSSVGITSRSRRMTKWSMTQFQNGFPFPACREREQTRLLPSY
jgi:hypothetical protein